MKIGYYLSLLTLATPVFAKPSFELLHWWTAKGEQAALSVIEDQFINSPIRLINDSIAGGGGSPAKTILQARAIAGNLPNIAQMEGPAIQSWAALGFLHNVNTIARSQDWDNVLYPEVQSIHQFAENYVAVPINIHRLNWMWVNTSILKQHHVDIPKDWDSLIMAFRELKKRGIPPIALGNEQWQVVQLFENIAYGVGGADYYRRAFVNLEPDALKSKHTEKALKRFRTISNLVGSELMTMKWDQGTQSLLNGEVAFQLTGDWALAEILSTQRTMPSHIECITFPSTENGFIYNIDSLAFFKTQQAHSEELEYIISSISNPDFLLEFNKKKGSIPAQKNIPVHSLSHCQQKSYHDFNAARKLGTAMPSFIDSMAVNPTIQNAVSNELFQYFNDSTITDDALISHLSVFSSNIPNRP
ncbi:carbohydrate ABC transporter substrate-binding protein [Vibrio sp. S9_S30]|uniref:ABC transporter substrate-binding protein n=1 Tax=Vibrio sp. S9_S30 TaxID=2720226 RepID=UPI00168100E9|nr:ABC transporter substrate-binding protein [Vibrio sp. S9_S30]MBD1558925.1 carbohydrate ABC transporter substrate-binding protein [Vibrio sp. S9_S30]